MESNTLAIAVVTTTIRHLLQQSLGGSEPGAVDGAAVTTLHPREVLGENRGDRGPTGLNLFLYDVTTSQAHRNDPLPSRTGDRARDPRPSVALDLHYLVTAYGDDAVLEPQRLLARAARALASVPVLSGPVIDAAIAEYGVGDTAFLVDSDLAEQAEAVRVVPTTLSLDEHSRLWRALATPCLPSLTYSASPVFL